MSKAPVITGRSDVLRQQSLVPVGNDLHRSPHSLRLFLVLLFALLRRLVLAGAGVEELLVEFGGARVFELVEGALQFRFRGRGVAGEGGGEAHGRDRTGR